jgi:hypothetical protein
MLALAGGIAALLVLVRPAREPYFIPVWITEYKEPQIPVNFLAEADRQALLAGNYFSSRSAFASQQKDLLLRELAQLKDRKPSDALVLYLCAFARKGANSELLLLPGDVKPDDLQTAIPFRKVLDAVRVSPAGHKLLVLDVMRPLADSRLGILADDVASRIPDELVAVEDPQRLVLCACSPGQVSLWSEAMGRSVFGYYLEEGLRGWADGLNPDGKRDGQVSVRELAEYVKHRVDRWAWRNRNTRQTPVLLGPESIKDFNLVALEHGDPQPHLEAPDSKAYPDWLQKGWSLWDDSWSEKNFQLAPRAFAQLGANLLRAEQEWRGGTDPGQVEKLLERRLGDFKDSLTQARAIAKVEPRSLAQAVSLGRKPDPKVTEAVKELLKKVAEPPADKAKEAEQDQNKLIEKFLDGNPVKEFDLAKTAFDLAVGDPNPAPEKIRFLAKLVQKHQPQPHYVETLFLSRLAKLADEYRNKPWPTGIIRRSLDVVREGEKAASQEKAFPWIRNLLEEAASARHNAEIVRASAGYSSLDQADAYLKKTADKYETIRLNSNTINDAYLSLDQAIVFLPAYVPFLIATPRYEETWLAATQSAQRLAEVLVPPPAGSPLSEAALSKRIDELTRKIGELQELLRILSQSFSKDDLQQLIKRSQRGDAGYSEWLEIDTILTTPFPTAGDRLALWKAGQELEARLHQNVVELDQDEDQRRQPDKTLTDFATKRETFERQERERAARRARYAIALLKLAGLAETATQKLEDALRQVAPDRADFASWENLGSSLRLAWAEKLPSQLQEEKSLAAQDRLARLIPPFDSSTLLDNASTNPCLLKRKQELAALWTWLAERYQYENHDLGSSGFYDLAARDYRQGPLPDVFLRFSDESSAPIVTQAKPAATVNLGIELSGPLNAKPKVELTVIPADEEWLEITPKLSGLAELTADRRSCLVPLQIRLKPGAQNARVPAPKGFLVQAALNGRAFHHRVKVSLTSGPEILLNANPKGAGPFLPELPPLQPGQGRSKYYLFLKNSPDKARILRVELLANGVEVARASDIKLPISKEPRLVDFGKAEVPAALPELRGPLQVRLMDAETDTELDTKNYKADIAVPSDSVEVSNIRWYPSSLKDGGKNRLEVRVQPKRHIPEPGIKVQLVLSPDQIPGLKSYKDGKFELLLLDKPEELYAVDIQLDDSAREDGLVYLTVAGFERAFIFNTTFKRRGDPTYPTRMEKTALRLAGPRYFESGLPLPIKVEVDNPPDGARLEVSLGKNEDGTFQNITAPLKFPQAREQRVGFSPQSPDGALVFEAVLKDWEPILQTAGIVGQREVRAVLIDRDGREITSAAPKEVILDNSKPTNLKFLEPELNGKEIRITAQGEDPDSGIKEVNFYLGKAEGDKPPDGAKPIKGKPAGKNKWFANFPDKKEEFDVSVEFINNAKMKKLATTQVPAITAGPAKPAKIQGSVVDASGFGKIGSPVVLFDDKGKVKDQTKTDKNAEFQFDKLEPGEYTVSSEGKNEKVQVESGKTKEVKIVAP